MIPTKFKRKLSKALSWPLGAEAISVGLGDAPHADECQLWFTDSPVWPASAFQRILREDQPYSVLAVEYTPVMRMGYDSSHAMAASGSYDAKWIVKVNPVLRTRRAMVGTLLRDQGLPAAADWLRSLPESGWRNNWLRFELVFAPATNTLSMTSKVP